MIRTKSFDSTGIAPNGRLYAGDLNAIEDAAAALSDFTQTVDIQTLRIGATDLQLTRFGANEAQWSGHVRALGIIRGFGGFIAGAFTTAQRDAIVAGMAPYGIVILNTTTNQYEWNKGTDVARDWRPFGVDTLLSLIFTGGASKVGFLNKTALTAILTSRRAAEAQDRLSVREDGRHDWGDGTLAFDTALYRDAASRIRIDNEINLGGYSIYFGNLGASMMIDGVASRIRGGTLSIQNADGSQEYGLIGNDFYRFKDARFAVRAVPQKMLIQQGDIVVPGAVSGTVTFPVAFSAAPSAVLVSTTAYPPGMSINIGPGAVTATGFPWGSDRPGTAHWVAIGSI